MASSAITPPTAVFQKKTWPAAARSDVDIGIFASELQKLRFLDCLHPAVVLKDIPIYGSKVFNVVCCCNKKVNHGDLDIFARST
jgi:hypothetical protein